MNWSPPIKLGLIPTSTSESFKTMPDGWTGIPIHPHPGAFAFSRKHHNHEGVDLYCPDGTEVFAVEPGVVVCIEPFTGEIANLPFWENTWSVLVEGPSGVVVYGEIIADEKLKVGSRLLRGDLVGKVTRVLKKDKGRPMSMLHIELHKHGTTTNTCWYEDDQPESMLDPTPYLMECAPRSWPSYTGSHGMFVKAESELIPRALIEKVVISEIEEGVVEVHHHDGVSYAKGLDALETVMLIKPSATEGRAKLRWKKGSWAFHNIVAHPLMQILAWLGFGKLAIQIHDNTAPEIRGLKFEETNRG